MKRIIITILAVWLIAIPLTASDDNNEHNLIRCCALNCHKPVQELLKQNKQLALAHDNERNTGLHYAACNGNVSLIRTLLEYGVDPRQRNSTGQTARDLLHPPQNPVSIALLDHHTRGHAIIEWISSPEHMTNPQVTPLIWQDIIDNLNSLPRGTIQQLINIPSSQGLTPIMHAALHCTAPIVKLLLEHGATIEPRFSPAMLVVNAFEETASHEEKQRYKDIISVLCEYSSEETSRAFIWSILQHKPTLKDHVEQYALDYSTTLSCGIDCFDALITAGSLKKCRKLLQFNLFSDNKHRLSKQIQHAPDQGVLHYLRLFPTQRIYVHHVERFIAHIRDHPETAEDSLETLWYLLRRCTDIPKKEREPLLAIAEATNHPDIINMLDAYFAQAKTPRLLVPSNSCPNLRNWLGKTIIKEK